MRPLSVHGTGSVDPDSGRRRISFRPVLRPGDFAVSMVGTRDLPERETRGKKAPGCIL